MSKINNLILPFDIYSRHTTIVNLILDSKSILDVGGCLKQLKSFINSDVKLFTTDVVGGDIIYDGQHLPFKTNSVDTVVSIDTIEHIHQKKRLPFLQELARVAKHQVVLAAPLGTQSHLNSEKKQLKKLKNPPQFLVEHVKYGLPRLEHIKFWLKHFPKHKLIFSGNHHLSQSLFKLHLSQIKLPLLCRIWYQLKKIMNVFINLTIYPFYKTRSLSQNINRFYIVISL